jgi:hypothetical protein
MKARAQLVHQAGNSTVARIGKHTPDLVPEGKPGKFGLKNELLRDKARNAARSFFRRRLSVPRNSRIPRIVSASTSETFI